MFKRLLVPLDGSPQAEQALPIAAHLAKASGASLLLFEAIRTPSEFGISSASAEHALHKAQEKRLIAAATYLSTRAHALEEEGIETRIAALPGQPASLILDTAKEEEIDLIVMCRHGRTGLSRWTLGSTSQKVMRQTTVPVLLLHGQKLIELTRHSGPFRTAVALDGSPFAEKALLPAAQLVTALSAPGEGELHLIRLVELPIIEQDLGALIDDEVDVHHTALQEASDYLQEIRARLAQESSTSGLHISWSVEECQDIADSLIQIAEQGKGIRTQKASDLIALATHGRSGLHRWLLGSVAERILHGSALPLLIIHPHAATDLLPKEKEQIAQA
jgi:nucleotide-binding universal stress UspA family protein